MIQDYILAIGNAVFVLALIPALRDRRAEMCRSTSITTGTILAVFAATHLTMDMPWATAMNVAGALAWYTLAALRPIRSDVPDLSISDHEYDLVLQYRRIKEQGFQKGGYINEPPPTMCGGCPVQGD